MFWNLIFWLSHDLWPKTTWAVVFHTWISRAGFNSCEVLLGVWVDIRRAIHWELLLCNQILAAKVYYTQPDRLEAVLKQNRPMLENRDDAIFYYSKTNLTQRKIVNYCFPWTIIWKEIFFNEDALKSGTPFSSYPSHLNFTIRPSCYCQAVVNM